MSKKRKRRFRGNRPFYMIVIVILIYASWIFIDQRIQLAELNSQKEDLLKTMEQLREKEQLLVQEKEMISDPNHIERIARERLKMVKPNEIIYIDQERARFQD